MKNKSGQIIIINSLRGLASLAVCLYHFVCTTTGFITNETLLNIFTYGKKGVHVFFIISGIVIPLSLLKSNYKIRSIGKYLLKRFIRIEPPYLAAVALGIAYLVARNFVPGSTQLDMTPSVRDIFLHIGYLVPFVEGAKWINPVFWTLSIEFQYYLFLSILFPLALSKKPILNWVLNAIVITNPFILSTRGFYLHWSAFFGVGIFYALFRSNVYTKTEFFITVALCSVVIFIEQSWIDLLIALTTISVIHAFPHVKGKIGLFLGEISYSLYLVHSIVGAAFINFMSHRISSPGGKFMVILGGIFISISFAYLFWRFIEKPSQRKSQQIKMSK
ncbi:MAG: acyltransferase [Bacteroidota bacterium]